MLVIHPKDRTTELLSLLYKDDETARVINTHHTHRSSKEVGRLLSHTSIDERPHSHQLRQHRGNIIRIWRNADKLACKEGLHGLFTLTMALRCVKSRS